MTAATPARPPATRLASFFRPATRRVTLGLALAALLVGCSDNPAEFQIGGTLSGLAPGAQVMLLNQRGDPLNLSENGPFRFPKTAPPGGSYEVTVGAQPTGQVCGVTAGFGNHLNAAVDSVRVTCDARSFALGGTVTGLAPGAQVTLLNNQGESLLIAADGSFGFPGPIPFNGSYAVTVGSQPPGQSCGIAGGTGSGAGVVADVRNVQVVCSALTYAIGGSLTGLAAGQQLVVADNGGDTLALSADGPFQFPGRLPWGSSYQVTVTQQPAGQTCSIAAGTGSGSKLAADVSGIALTCSTKTYAISGTLSGLGTGVQVTLANNGADPITLGTNSRFIFPVPVAWGGSYDVTVLTQPQNQTCTVTQGQGSGVTQSVSTVQVSCKDNTFLVGGTLIGLPAGAVVKVTNTVNGDSVDLSANGAYTLPTPITVGGSYALSIAPQPGPNSVPCGTLAASGGLAVGGITVDNVICLAAPFSAASLQWYRAPGDYSYNWTNGNALCTTAGLRLPTRTELVALQSALGNVGGILWSSEAAPRPGYDWALNLNFGAANQQPAGWPGTTALSVLCVQ